MKIYQIHRHVNKENVLMSSYSDKSKDFRHLLKCEGIVEDKGYKALVL